MRQIITRDVDNKIVGGFTGDCYRKNVKKSKHYMMKFHGYGIDKSILVGLKERNVDYIILNSTEEKTYLTTTVTIWLEKGREADFGYGMQVFLNESVFMKEFYGKRDCSGGII